MQSRSYAATPADRLEALKREFPAHLSGPVTEKSDPAIQKCWNGYKARVERLTMENLATELYKIQDSATHESSRSSTRRNDHGNVLTTSGRHAEEQNVLWLRQKLIPYLKRIAQFQRGR